MLYKYKKTYDKVLMILALIMANPFAQCYRKIKKSADFTTCTLRLLFQAIFDPNLTI